MKCASHQPQFLPWLGYLHKIRSADVFVYASARHPTAAICITALREGRDVRR